MNFYTKNYVDKLKAENANLKVRVEELNMDLSFEELAHKKSEGEVDALKWVIRTQAAKGKK